MSMKKINSVTRAPTVARALEGIRDKIVLHEFKSGETLTETALATEYGVSRGSIRSVLYMLESEGLISTQPNGRRVVIEITDKFIADLYDTRILLECKAASICIESSVVDYSKMANSIARFYTLRSARKETLYVERTLTNTGFHRALIESANNRSLLQCWETVEPLLHAFIKLNYLTLDNRTDDEALMKSHTDIMDMIMKKDPLVVDELDKHVRVAVGESIDGWNKRIN